jgi:hypothetical protein
MHGDSTKARDAPSWDLPMAKKIKRGSRTLRVESKKRDRHPLRRNCRTSSLSDRRDQDSVILNYFNSNLNTEAFGIGVGSWFGTINLHAPFEISTILNADPSRCNVAAHRTILLDLDSVTRTKISRQLTVDNDFASGDIGIQLSSPSYS